uniref:Uncharacterized protein n=1 Tax=Cacopsylla melanoneura TaxID=428564 RepID=A0A8D9BVU5_9HEMI
MVGLPETDRGLFLAGFYCVVYVRACNKELTPIIHHPNTVQMLTEMKMGFSPLKMNVPPGRQSNFVIMSTIFNWTRKTNYSTVRASKPRTIANIKNAFEMSCQNVVQEKLFTTYIFL